MSREALRISITTGDPDGIGSEITAKALQELRPQSGVYFYLWRSPECNASDLRRIDKQFRRVTVANWEEALRVPLKSNKTLVDICSPLSPAHWVETSALACSFNRIEGMATAPLSKTSIKKAGFSDIGHTDILKRISGRSDLFMTFIGDVFNVLLVTDHIPLGQVPEELSAKKIVEAAKAAHDMKEFLPKKFRDQPLAILGLNPHAGESGLIGTEEQKLFKRVGSQLDKLGIAFEGPLVPDAAFFGFDKKKYSFYVCLYHDQGLIPFKMVHGQDSGVHITSNLPFVRTSVDHGTAKDIFGKNKANPASMLASLRWCIDLCRKKYR